MEYPDNEVVILLQSQMKVQVGRLIAARELIDQAKKCRPNGVLTTEERLTRQALDEVVMWMCSQEAGQFQSKKNIELGQDTQ